MNGKAVKEPGKQAIPVAYFVSPLDFRRLAEATLPLGNEREGLN